MEFYITLFVIAGITVAPAIFEYLKGDRTGLSLRLLMVVIAGAIASMCLNYNAHHDAVRTDSLYQNLLNRNLDSSTKIIDTMNVALKNTKGLLLQNQRIIEEQGSSASKLNDQIKATSGLQSTIVKSGRQLLNQIDTATSRIKNQLSDDSRYTYFYLTITGNKRYQWSLQNEFNDPVFVYSVTITNYDSLLRCNFVDQHETIKISKKCYEKNSFFTDGQLITVTFGAMEFPQIPTNLAVGLHRYEVSFSLRNRHYIQQMIYLVNEDHSLNQTSRIITFSQKPKNIAVIKSKNEEFNKWVKWNRLFPLSLMRIYYD